MEEREIKDDSSAMPYYKHVGSAEQGGAGGWVHKNMCAQGRGVSVKKSKRRGGRHSGNGGTLGV